MIVVTKLPVVILALAFRTVFVRRQHRWGDGSTVKARRRTAYYPPLAQPFRGLSLPVLEQLASGHRDASVPSRAPL